MMFPVEICSVFLWIVVAEGSWSNPQSKHNIGQQNLPFQSPPPPPPPPLLRSPAPYQGDIGRGRALKTGEAAIRQQMNEAELAFYHETDTLFEPDNRHDIQHEFKVNIGPSRQECFFQKMNKSSQFHFYFQVLSGADRNIDAIIRSPDGKIVDEHLWINQGRTERVIIQPGVYSICLGNLMSRFSSKLIHFYMASFLTEEWHRIARDLEQFDVEVQNFSRALQEVHQDMNTMERIQAMSRQAAAADWYLIQSENQAVQSWSIFICVVIVCTSISQVVFVRRLFRVPGTNTTHTNLRA